MNDVPVRTSVGRDFFLCIMYPGVRQKRHHTHQAVPVLNLSPSRLSGQVEVPLKASVYVLVLRDRQGNVLGEMDLLVD